MKILIVLAVLLIFKLTRCILFNLHRVAFYLGLDTFQYLKGRKWKEWNGFGLNAYVGYFGKGKTLCASHYVISQAKRYGLTVYSNIRLNGIEYIPLKNFQQIIDADGNSIFLIDECSTLFNSRQWKDFPVDLLFQLLQCRKQKKQLILTAQRFAHIDKAIRDITFNVYDCSKHWRFQHIQIYDGWDYENCMNIQMLGRVGHSWSFVTNKWYESYDTSELIDNAKKTDFISNEERQIKLGEVVFNDLGVSKPSRKLKKRRRGK